MSIVFGSAEANLIAKKNRLLTELVEYFSECRDAIRDDGYVLPEVWHEYSGECPDYLKYEDYLALMKLAVSTVLSNE